MDSNRHREGLWKQRKIFLSKNFYTPYHVTVRCQRISERGASEKSFSATERYMRSILVPFCTDPLYNLLLLSNLSKRLYERDVCCAISYLIFSYFHVYCLTFGHIPRVINLEQLVENSKWFFSRFSNIKCYYF